MEPISSNALPELPQVKIHRRRHSPTFKAEVLAACAQPGASIAAVAQRYQINANLVHKWRKAARAHDSSATQGPGFQALTIPAPTAADVRVTLIIGAITIHWPVSHIQQAVPWLKALQA